MESIEGALNESLEPNKTPESQMAAHQVRKSRGTGGLEIFGKLCCVKEFK